MSADRSVPGANEEENAEGYFRRVQQDTWRFVEKLMQQNRRLEALVGSLETDRQACHGEVAALRRELEALRKRDGSLQAQMAEAEQLNQSLAEQFEAVERQSSSLTSLYVASHRIHATSRRHEVLQAVEEIVINLIGCEELAVFERVGTEPVLQRVHSVGIEGPRDLMVAFGEGTIGRAAASGRLYVRDRSSAEAEEGDVTACIPLRLEGVVTGAIAVYRLLPHKPGLEELDFELFELLAMHAATALRFTALEALARGGALRGQR